MILSSKRTTGKKSEQDAGIRRIASLAGSTALTLLLAMGAAGFGTRALAQTVNVGAGETVTISPTGDYDPASVSQVIVTGGTLSITDDSQITGDVSGLGNGIVFVRNDDDNLGSAIITGGSISNISTGIGNALFVSGNGASIEASGVELYASGDGSTGQGSAHYGAHVDAGASLKIDESDISVSGTYGIGLGTTANKSAIQASSVNIETSGASGFGANAFVYAGSNWTTAITISDSSIITSGWRALGAYAANKGSTIDLLGTSIQTLGDDASGAVADRGAAITITDATISTEGSNAHGLMSTRLTVAQGGGTGESAILGFGGTISTQGDMAHGAYALDSHIELTGSEITTDGYGSYGAYARTQDADAATIILTNGTVHSGNDDGLMAVESHGLVAEGAGAMITANGTAITTLGLQSHGAQALDGGEIALETVNIGTQGGMAHGIHSHGAGSLVGIKVSTITVEGESAAALAAEGGAIHAEGLTLNAVGDQSRGLVSRSSGTTGLVNFTDGIVNASGVDALIGLVADGSTLLIDGSTLESGQGDGIHLEESATLTLADSTIAADGSTFASLFIVADQTQDIGLTGASVATENNGTLLFVDRSAVGSGVVNLLLGAGSQSSGDILDQGEKTGLGGTYVTLEGGATFSGAMQGVTSLALGRGSTLALEGSTLASINGGVIRLEDSATLALTGSTISAGGATFTSIFTTADQTQNISLAGASVATENDGTLLFVDRSTDGSGIVTLTLGEGSQSSGDILDPGEKTSLGATHVQLEGGASWSGTMVGVTTLSLSDGSSAFSGALDAPSQLIGNVAVDSEALLGGVWEIGGMLVSGGVIAPGNSIGVIEVDSLTLDPNSEYEVEINLAGESDLLKVAGSAMLDGIVVLKPIDGFLIDSPYEILTAASITGEFSGVEWDEDWAFLQAVLQHNTDNVQLLIARNDVGFAEAAANANEAAVGDALDSLGFNHALASTIAKGTLEEAQKLLSQLTGEVHASILSGLVAESQGVRVVANDRMRAAFDGVGGSGANLAYTEASDPAGLDGPASWATAYGWRATTDATDNSAAFDRQGAGMLVGADGSLGDWRVGALAGYSRSTYDADDIASSADADHIHLGLYGGSQWGAIGLRTGIAYTWSEIDTSRYVAFVPETLTGHYTSETFQVFGELGYRMDIESASFEPFANLAHVRSRSDAYSETGGITALDVASSSASTTFSTVGLRAATEPMSMGASLHGMIGWRYAAGDVSPTVLHSIDGSDAFAVSGAPIAENAAVVEAGVNVALGAMAKLDISYAGQYGSGAEMHGVSSTLSFGF